MPDKNELLNQGFDFYLKKEYDTAIEKYNKALDIDENYKEAWHYLGVAYRHKGEYDTAIEKYNKALDIDENFKEAWYGLGVAYGHKGEYDKAIEKYNKAIDIDENYKEAWHDLGVAYIQKVEYDTAIESFQQALDIDENFKEAWNNLGVAYGHKEEYDTAIESFQKALDIDENYKEAWHDLGVAYRHKGEYDKAIEKYNKAIEIDKNYKEAWYNLGLAYGHKGEYDKVIESFQKALDIDENYKKAWHDLGVAYIHKGEYENTLICLDKAILIDPSFYGAWENKIKVLRHLNRNDDLNNCFYDLALLNSCGELGFLNYKAGIYKDNDIHEEADQNYKKANEADPDFYKSRMERWKLLNDLNWGDKWREEGKELLKIERYAEAVLCFRKSASCNFDLYHEAWIDAGDTFKELRMYENAISSYNEVLGKDKYADKYPEASIKKAQCYIEYGNCNGAVEIFENIDLKLIKMHNAVKDLIRAYCQTKNYDKAKEIIDEVSKWSIPEREINKLNAVYSYYYGDYKEAMEYINNANDYSITDIDIPYLKGLISLSLEDYVNAKNSFADVLDIDSNHIDSLLKKADIHEKLNEKEEAVKVYETALEIDREYSHVSIESLLNLADLHYELNNYDKALSYYDKSLLLNDGKNDIYTVRGMKGKGLIYEKRKQYEKSKTCFEYVIRKLDSKDDFYKNAKSIYNNLSNRIKKLEDTIKKVNIKKEAGKIQSEKIQKMVEALKDHPENYTLYYKIAEYNENLNEKKKARENYEKSVKYHYEDYLLKRHYMDETKLLKNINEIVNKCLDIINRNINNDDKSFLNYLTVTMLRVIKEIKDKNYQKNLFNNNEIQNIIEKDWVDEYVLMETGMVYDSLCKFEEAISKYKWAQMKCLTADNKAILPEKKDIYHDIEYHKLNSLSKKELSQKGKSNVNIGYLLNDYVKNFFKREENVMDLLFDCVGSVIGSISMPVFGVAMASASIFVMNKVIKDWFNLRLIN